MQYFLFYNDFSRPGPLDPGVVSVSLQGGVVNKG